MVGLEAALEFGPDARHRLTAHLMVMVHREPEVIDDCKGDVSARVSFMA